MLNCKEFRAFKTQKMDDRATQLRYQRRLWNCLRTGTKTNPGAGAENKAAILLKKNEKPVAIADLFFFISVDFWSKSCFDS
ncbi:MAG: hypothetical protein V4642_02845 [Bacteroidota bacterium]